MRKKNFWETHDISSQAEEGDKRSQQIHEAEEKLEAMGQRSDKKAVKWVKKVVDQQEEEEKKNRYQEILKLKNARKFDSRYVKKLIKLIQDRLGQIGWPKYGFVWQVGYTRKGIIVAVKNQYGDVFKRAFRTCFKPKYDLNACKQLAVWAEDIMDYSTGRLETMKTPGGVWLPPKKSSLSQ